jgi:hypothetical protein
MFVAAQTGVHVAPGKRPPLGSLPHFAPLDGVFEAPARLLVIEYLRSLFQHDLPEDFGHGVQVFESIERKPVVTGGHEAFRAAAILGRAGAIAVGTEGIALPGLWLQPILDADLMAPGNVEVILVDEPRTFTEPQCRQGRVWRRRRYLLGTVARGAQAELIKVNAFPAHCNLDHAMEFSKTERCRHQDAAPDHRADARQPNLDLQDLASVCRRRGFGHRCLGWFSAASSGQIIASSQNPTDPDAPHLHGPPRHGAACAGAVRAPPWLKYGSHEMSEVFRRPIQECWTNSFSMALPTDFVPMIAHDNVSCSAHEPEIKLRS